MAKTIQVFLKIKDKINEEMKLGHNFTMAKEIAYKHYEDELNKVLLERYGRR